MKDFVRRSECDVIICASCMFGEKKDTVATPGVPQFELSEDGASLIEDLTFALRMWENQQMPIDALRQTMAILTMKRVALDHAQMEHH